MVVTLPVTVKFPVTVTVVIQILGVNISCTTTSPPGTSGDTRATINNFKSFPSKDDYNSNKKKSASPGAKAASPVPVSTFSDISIVAEEEQRRQILFRRLHNAAPHSATK